MKIKKKKSETTSKPTESLDEYLAKDITPDTQEVESPAKKPTFKILSQMHEQELNMVKSAAKTAGKTVSAWCRKVLVAEAAHVLSVPEPALPDFAHGPNSTVKEAADKLGLSVKEFKRRAAELLVSQTLAPPARVEESAA